MKTRTLILASTLACLAFTGSAWAHGSGGLSGSVTIWGGDPYGGGYAGNVYYGPGYVPVYPAPRLYWYEGCNHWHPRGFRHAARHAYHHDYGHRHYRHHKRHHKHHRKHHRHHH